MSQCFPRIVYSDFDEFIFILTALLSLIFGGILGGLYFLSQAQTKNTPLKSSRFFTLNNTKILSSEDYKQALLGVILIFSVCIEYARVSIFYET